MKKRVRLNVEGIIQGVGFRPFAYILAKKYGLSGFILNDCRGVIIEIQGPPAKINSFTGYLKKNPPANCRIEKIKKESLPLKNEIEFVIRGSLKTPDKFVLISADLAVCPDCLVELFKKNNRRYMYPFINCVACGPRLSIIKGIPYDRPKTTMNRFKMCPACRKEYDNPRNRRFYAQPNACFDCGPAVAISTDLKRFDYGNTFLQTKDILSETAGFLMGGKILAIKGVSGYHVACNAKDITAVGILRKRKTRPDKPFALMVDSLETAREFCFVSGEEEKLLCSAARPITILKIKRNTAHNRWINAIAPGYNCLGVMLCCAPLHYLIFDFLKKYDSLPVLVMTSANRKDFPLAATEEAAAGLNGQVDYFLSHNRPVYFPCDDSIARVFKEKAVVIRPGRGFTPEFLDFKQKFNIFAAGAELKSSFSIAKDNYLVTGPYIGDLKNYAVFEFYKEAVARYKKLFNFKPGIVAYDLHPSYLSTRYALGLPGEKIGIQHHHAHIASCMLENSLDRDVIGVCMDGAGYGLDGKTWGGEFFISSSRAFKRAAHFKYFGLIGGDKAVEEPARVAFYLLYEIFGPGLYGKDFDFLKCFDEKTLRIFSRLVTGSGCSFASSAGRLFDAASSILGLRHKISYEAQGAVDLEMLAESFAGKIAPYDYSITRPSGIYIIDWRPFFRQLAEGILKTRNKPACAYRFHYTMACIIKDTAVLLRKDYGIKSVVLSGGVFQNTLLLEMTVKLLEKSGFFVYWHSRFPSNDAGISPGQAAAASKMALSDNQSGFYL